MLAGLRLIDAFFYQRGDVNIRNADAGFTRTEEQDLLVAQLRSRDAHGGDQACDGHAAGSLDIVVEEAGLVAVLLEQAERVRVTEVLDLDQDAGKNFRGRLDEFVDQLVVVRAAFATALDAVVERVVQ